MNNFEELDLILHHDIENIKLEKFSWLIEEKAIITIETKNSLNFNRCC